MAKNVVVCCDGKVNEFAKDHTNVLKLFRVWTTTKSAGRFLSSRCRHDGSRRRLDQRLPKNDQVSRPRFRLWPRTRRLRCLCLSDAAIRSGRVLFMFGFSRGAYTVRAVASLLHMYGLLLPGNEPLVPYAIRMMNATNRQKAGQRSSLPNNSVRRFAEPSANHISSAFGTPLIRSDGSKIP